MKNTKGILRKTIAMLLMGVMVATTVPAGILDATAPADVYAVEKEDDLSLSQAADESTAQDELSEQTDENEDISESETLSEEEQDSETEATEESATEDLTEETTDAEKETIIEEEGSKKGSKGKETVELLSGTSTYTDLIPTSSDNDSALASKAVRFNGIKWYIIADDSTSATFGTVTLFALDPIDKLKFNDNANNDSYAGSKVRAYLDSLTTGSGSFAGVANAIVGTDLSDVGVFGAKLFLLNYWDANGLPTNVKKNYTRFNDDRKDYWLRSTHSTVNGSLECVVGADGLFSEYGGEPDNVYGVRPALKLDLACVNFESNTRTFTLNPSVRVVNIIGGANAAVSGGSTRQAVTGAINNVTYTANQGYCFKSFKAFTNNGITVIRISATTVMVTGTPTGNVNITVPDAVPIPVYTSLIPTGSDNEEALAAKQVSFGGHKWYVIDDNSTSETEGSVTLFAVNSLGESKFDGRYDVEVINKYSASEIKRMLDDMTKEGGMFADVADVIKTVNIVTKGYNSDETYDTCNNVKLYLPDIATVKTLPKKVIITNSWWWLRSPGSAGRQVTVVDALGNLVSFVDARESHSIQPFLQLDLSKVVFVEGSKIFIPKSGYSVTISGGTNATASGGNTSQTGLKGAMTTVTYTAKEGYHFEAFNDITDHGITVTRTDAKTVTVSGTPEKNVNITVPDAVAGYSVTISGGTNATASGGNTSQTGLAGAMTTVTYTAKEGYHFEAFNDITDHGITVTRTNAKTVTVSGTPEDNVTISVPDAVPERAASVSSDGVTKEYAKFDEAVAAWNEAGAGATLTLLKNVEINRSIIVNGGTEAAPMTLDLNDHGILLVGSDSVIEINSGSHFILTDTAVEQTTRYVILTGNRGSAVTTKMPESGDFLTVKGGYLTGGTGKLQGNGSRYGGGIYNRGTAVISGGTILGNDAMCGGGVYNFMGTLTIQNAEICDNSAHFGGGIYSAEGAFTMDGGVIKRNSATSKADAIWSNDDPGFIMNGGEIAANTNSNKDAIECDRGIKFGDGVILAGSKADGTDAVYMDPDEVNNNLDNIRYLKLSSGEELSYVASINTTSGQETKYDSFDTAVSAWKTAGAGATLKLLDDVKITDEIEVTGGTSDAPMILDLNDHGILYAGSDNSSCIKVCEGGSFKLTDSSSVGTTRYIITDPNGRGTAVSMEEPEEGTDYVSVQGGYITGTTYSCVFNKGLFEMESGTILANTALYDAGGVTNFDTSEFIMNGGAIKYNKGSETGGIVLYNGASFIMRGGEISNNRRSTGFNAIWTRGNVTVTFSGSIRAGEEPDGSDAKYVSPEDAADKYGTYGYIKIVDDVFLYDPIEPVVYTGKAITPDVKVYYGETLLQKDKDYTIKFSNNTNAGTATFTITGKGNYKGKETGTFEIKAKKLDIDDDQFQIPLVSYIAAYNKNKSYKPVPSLSYNGKKLKNGKDFEVSYYASDEDMDNKENPVSPKEPGMYYMRLDGIKNFYDYTYILILIADKTQTPVSKLTVSKIKDQPYTGKKIKPEPVVKMGNTVLTEGTDYELSYDVEENIEIGTGVVIITGKGSYSGSRAVTFNIKGIPMNKVTVNGIPKKAVVYDGTEQKPTLALSYKANKKADPLEIKWATQEHYKEMSADEQAEIGCIVSYVNNTKVGTATVTLEGINGCSGTVKKTFKITPFVVTNDESDLFKVEVTEHCPFAKGGAKPIPVVSYKGTELTEGVDYKVSYANNKAVNDGTGSKKPTVKVTGKGNFKGTDTSATFAIVTADMEETGVKVTANDVVFRNKADKWKAKYTVVGPDGKALKAGTDYDNKNVEYAYDENFADLIPEKTTVPVGTTIYMRVTAKGASYSGTATGSYRIIPSGHDISKLSVKINPKEYTGKEIRLSNSDITWKSGKKAVDNVKFVIDSSTYTNNINKGTASVIVRGTGEWGGSKKVTFKISARGIKWWEKLIN